MTFVETLRHLKGIVESDGKIDIERTSVLLREIRPFVLKGDAQAKMLNDMLLKFRGDRESVWDEGKTIVSVIDGLTNNALPLDEYMREIQDFPKPGVLFRDITGLLDTAEGFNMTLDGMAAQLSGLAFDVVVAPESRGFIFGSALAAKFRKAFVPIRKPGKLPRATISETYNLEYGTATLHIHTDAIISGERAVVVDDLLATGGTALAAAHLVEKLGGKVVKMLFPVELKGFAARENLLKDYSVDSLIQYEGK